MEVQTTLTNLETLEKIVSSKNMLLRHNAPAGSYADLRKWLPNLIMPINSTPQGKWETVNTKTGTSESTMLKTAQKMCLPNAVDLYTQEFQNGVFDKAETFRLIFLEETSQADDTLGLIFYRDNSNEVFFVSW